MTWIQLALQLIFLNVCSGVVITSFQGNNFSHIELYQNNGEEFIILAQKNQLVNLRWDFTQEFVTKTGPRNDSATCQPHQVQQNLPKCQMQPEDNFVKAMQIRHRHLYVCMTYLRGSCAKVALEKKHLFIDFASIDSKLEDSTRAILCRDPKANIMLTVSQKFTSEDSFVENGLYLAMPVCDGSHFENAVESVISIVNILTLKPFRIGGFSSYVSEIVPEQSLRQQNLVNYHYSFEYMVNNSSFVFFVLTARDMSSMRPMLRIARLCAKDLYMVGYVEVKLQCSSPEMKSSKQLAFVGETATLSTVGSYLAATMNISETEKVLFFTTRVLDGSRLIQQGVCAVPMRVINQYLDNVVEDCAQGRGMLGPPYIRQVTQHCKKMKSGSYKQRSYCFLSKRRPDWAGMFSSSPKRLISAKFIIDLGCSSANITALAAQKLDNGATVLNLGTTDGHLLRYNLETYSRQWLFENTSAGAFQSPVLAIRCGASRLYTLQSNEVASHQFEECKEKYKSCHDCLTSHNPYCIWIKTTGGCRNWHSPLDRRAQITSATLCLEVVRVQGSSMNVESQAETIYVNITARNVPLATFFCYYTNSLRSGGSASSTAAEIVRYQHKDVTIKCPVKTSEMSEFLNGRSMKHLTLRLTGDRCNAVHYFVAVNITIFSCRVHPNCTSCMQSGTRCVWWFIKGVCVHSVDKDQLSYNGQKSFVSTVDKCPFAWPENASKLIVPSGTVANLHFFLQGYQAFMESFICEINCIDSVSTFTAELLETVSSKQLLCKTGPLKYSTNTASATCKLSIYWYRNLVRQQMDSSPSMQLVLYKCGLMANKCDDCTLYTHPKFRCGWCLHSGLCSDNCNQDRIGSGDLCPYPVVREIWPTKITCFGNLVLNVSGSNLGVSTETVRSMLVSGQNKYRCELLPESYRPGHSFACRVSGNRLILPGNETRLYVTLRSNLRTDLKTKDAYRGNLTAVSIPLSIQQPHLLSVSSKYVQQSGQAVIVLSGYNLDAGSEISIRFLHEHYTPSLSHVIFRGARRMPVRLSKFIKTGRYFVELSLQSVYRKTYHNISLYVVRNSVPAVSEPRRTVVPAGGLKFRIAVQRLHAVQKAILEFKEVSGKNRLLEVTCKSYTATEVPHLVCLSPPLPLGQNRERREASTDKSPFFFALKTNFSVVVHLDALVHSYGIVQLVQQPKLRRITSQKVQLLQESPKTHDLKLYGVNLLPTLRLSDIEITVGNTPCPVLNLHALPDGTDQVTCQLTLNSKWVDLTRQVRVSIGREEYDLGSIVFATKFNWVYAYASAAVGIVLLLALAASILLHAHRRSNRRNKSQRIEVQINLLEAQVSQTCRDAFAELQLNSGGDKRQEEYPMPMPIKSFNEFACYTCFGERYSKRHASQDHIFTDIHSTVLYSSNELQSALDEFHALLMNEDFLLAMIATVESKPEEFKQQERNRFGSLLSALMYERIDYFTVILTKLMKSLIDKKREANDNYKVLFRRCDSVAERLLPNWLAFLMYEQLASCVAEPLYNLYCDIKLQIYKGPVDQVTEDSKYTLNEQKLLKKEVSYSELNVTFEDREQIFRTGTQPMLKFEFILLDCDSVQQAKEKIIESAYCRKQVPYSLREAASEFCLVLAQPLEQSEGIITEHTILSELEDADHCDNNHRLRRIGSYSATKPAILFLKRCNNSSDTLVNAIATNGSYPLTASIGCANSSISLHECSTSGRLYPNETRYWHLVPPYSSRHATVSGKRKRKKRNLLERSDDQQIVSEVFYPVLLRTKRLLTDRITDLFVALFPVQQMEQSPSELESVPLCIKYLFDLLDDIGFDKRLSRDVAHVWKANALMLRFYTHNLLNLDCLLDVFVPGPVKYCMSTVSTVFMEACSVEKPGTPDRSAPAQKLLFVNEIADFHPKVESYFQTISNSGIREPFDDIVAKFQQQVEFRNCRPFNTSAVLLELFHSYAKKYHRDIEVHLERRCSHAALPLIKTLDFCVRTILSYSPSCSNSQTLCSTYSSSKPFVQTKSNPYD